MPREHSRLPCQPCPDVFPAFAALSQFLLAFCCLFCRVLTRPCLTLSRSTPFSEAYFSAASCFSGLSCRQREGGGSTTGTSGPRGDTADEAGMLSLGQEAWGRTCRRPVRSSREHCRPAPVVLFHPATDRWQLRAAGVQGSGVGTSPRQFWACSRAPRRSSHQRSARLCRQGGRQLQQDQEGAGWEKGGFTR